MAKIWDRAPEKRSPAVEEARQAFQALMKIGCTGCRYCMPCPAGVDIPFCCDLYNRVRSFNEIKFHNMARYAMHLGGIEGERSFASKCVECGKCVEKCPQGLDIPLHLKSVAKEFETLVFKLFLVYGRFFFSRIR